MSEPNLPALIAAAREHLLAGRLNEAEAVCREALSIDPQSAAAWQVLADIAGQVGRADVAGQLLKRSADAWVEAIRRRPDDAHNFIDLARVLHHMGEIDRSVGALREAIRLRPDLAIAHFNLGGALRALRHIEDAETSLRKAIAIDPSLAEAHAGLGDVLMDQALHGDAIASYRRAIELDPSSPQVHSKLLYATHFDPAFDARQVLAEHRAWNERHIKPLSRFVRPHDNDPNPRRRLRIGYVSPNFCVHPVGQFVLPLLALHDANQFEVFLYSCQEHPGDPFAERLAAGPHRWRAVHAMSDERLDRLIREDRIDILVDLAMHTDHNRLPVFGRRPAPVQGTYLAYASTSGTDAIDFRFTDEQIDPPGERDDLYAERSVRLATTYWCYTPPGRAPAVADLPAARNGFVTFGSLNDFAKASTATIAAWAAVLRSVADSRLLLHAHEGPHRDRVLRDFGQLGVAADRVRFVGRQDTGPYLATYGRIDVALDPIPYTGGTTTCDALWMGVPVVTLAGETGVSRSGLSILSRVGLGDHVATSVERYVGIAGDLAGDLTKLAGIRSSLRERMKQSPLMNAPAFVRDVETNFRSLWQRWCEKNGR